MARKRKSEFEKAAEEAPQGYFSEMWAFFKNNKKWWLLPILLVLLVFGLLIVLSGTGLAPFIYTLF